MAGLMYGSLKNMETVADINEDAKIPNAKPNMVLRMAKIVANVIRDVMSLLRGVPMDIKTLNIYCDSRDAEFARKKLVMQIMV